MRRAGIDAVALTIDSPDIRGETVVWQSHGLQS
jgi:hypothetical protein